MLDKLDTSKVKGVPRQNAQAKDSEWVRDREILEKDKPADVNEILLSTTDRSVLEGMTSNFFAIIDGELWTAGEGILLGTVREILLEQCKAHNVNLWDGTDYSTTCFSRGGLTSAIDDWVTSAIEAASEEL